MKTESRTKAQKEKRKEYMRWYRLTYPEKVKASRKLFVLKYPERKKELYKKYREANRESLLEYSAKYRTENSRKVTANHKVAYAIHMGKMEKGTICKKCNSVGVPLVAHHWSYEEKNWLNVIWLCKSCHTQEHNILKNDGINLV